ncbi:MAG: hypothetical protein PHH77_05860 [Victivallaceae bacterium]|nr:hypothetical protein [Victivallaceae bacterium]
MNALQMLRTIGWGSDSLNSLTLLTPSDVFELSAIGTFDFNSDGTRFIKSADSVHVQVYAMSESGFALEEDIEESSAASVSYLGMSADGNVLAYQARYSGEYTVKIWERAEGVWSQVASVPWYFTGDTETPNLQRILNFLPDKTGFLMQTYDAWEVTTYEVYFYKKQSSGWTFDRYSVSGPPSSTKTNRAIKPATQTPEYCVQFGWVSSYSGRYPVIYRKNASNLWEYAGIISSDAYGDINRGTEDCAWRDNKLLLLRENTSGYPVIAAYDPDTLALTEQHMLPMFFRNFDFTYLQFIKPALCSTRRSGILYCAGDARDLYFTGLDAIGSIESWIKVKDDFPDMNYGSVYLFDDKVILVLGDGTSHKVATYTF